MGMRIPVFLWVGVVATACSGSSSSSLSGAGAFTPNSEIAGFPGSLDDGGIDSSTIAIGIVHIDQGPQSCGTAPGGETLTGRLVAIGVSTGDGTTLQTGQYPIVSLLAPKPTTVSAVLALGDFNGDLSEVAESGSVTLTEVGATFAGSFTATLVELDGGAFGVLSGTFSAPTCTF